MRVLFISSSHNDGKPTPVVQNQAHSLSQLGIDIDYFTITEKGIQGYLKATKELRKYNQGKSFDIYHAHYGLSAIVATLAGVKPLVVSLMGSDVKEGGWQLRAIRVFSRYNWQHTITKSTELASLTRCKNCSIIPNGINQNKFFFMEKDCARKNLNWDLNKNYILFAADPKRPEKNFELTEKAYQMINNENWSLVVLENVPNDLIPLYMNASDVIVLSSLWEGSPNVIKEAMACNRPIVTTNVGDIEWLFGNEPGHFIADFNPSDFAVELKKAMLFSLQNRKTGGRERIISLGLDSQAIAKRIAEVYKLVIK